MNLSQLMRPLTAGGGLPDIQVASVTCDSRQVEKGTVFVCVRGETQDGHNHAAEALQRGASFLVCQRDCGVPNQLLVKDSRQAYGRLCAEFFGNPSKQMKLIGVTGTNGKTTSSWLIKQLLEEMGNRVGLIGTIRNQICGSEDCPPVLLPANYTTPDPWELQGLLRRMADRGCEYVVMEASSHALAQKRLEGCEFLCGVFTNLTPEHLDFHKTMEGYFQAKKSLFSLCRKAVVNLDGEYGRRLAEELPKETLTTFSVCRDDADYTAHQTELSREGSRFVAVGGEENRIARAFVPLPGEFSVSNGMAALSAAAACGFPLEQAAEGLSRCPGVPGRTELLTRGKKFTVIRDYAHTPDGLEKVLTALRSTAKQANPRCAGRAQNPQGRMITLFGCAGRRDRSRRADMAETAARLSDLVVLTADNPREESLDQIFEDARPGLERQHTPCKVIADRREAIRWALSRCREGDTLLLAGKGHEDYQVLADRTICFDERQIVQEYFDSCSPS